MSSQEVEELAHKIRVRTSIRLTYIRDRSIEQMLRTVLFSEIVLPEHWLWVGSVMLREMPELTNDFTESELKLIGEAHALHQ